MFLLCGCLRDGYISLTSTEYPMCSSNILHLYEEVLLLALRDKEGTVFASVHYHIALGAALVAELIIEGIADVQTSGKKKYLVLNKYTLTGDELLDECIEKIAKAKRRATVQTYLSRFSNIKNLKQRAAAQLCRRKILKEKEDKILLLFKRKIYPERDPRPEREIIARLNDVIFNTDRIPDMRTIALLSIADSVEILKLIFSKKELKQKKQRIKAISNGEIAGQAARETIAALQSALVIAAVMPAVMAGASASH